MITLVLIRPEALTRIALPIESAHRRGTVLGILPYGVGGLLAKPNRTPATFIEAQAKQIAVDNSLTIQVSRIDSGKAVHGNNPA